MQLLPAHVKGARGMLGWSQQDLAAASGIAVQTIANFEAERHTPREETLMRIQAALEERGIVFSNGNSPTVKLDPSRVKAVGPPR